VLKAYDFFVLLGKYKRKQLTEREFDLLLRAVRTVRGYRYSFHESTGERRPVPPPGGFLSEEKLAAEVPLVDPGVGHPMGSGVAPKRVLRRRKHRRSWSKRCLHWMDSHRTLVVLGALVGVLFFALLLHDRFTRRPETAMAAGVGGQDVSALAGDLPDSEAVRFSWEASPGESTFKAPDPLGLEQALEEGMDAMLLRPEDELARVEAPPQVPLVSKGP
jgi:hypothetical protein